MYELDGGGDRGRATLNGGSSGNGRRSMGFANHGGVSFNGNTFSHGGNGDMMDHSKTAFLYRNQVLGYLNIVLFRDCLQ